MSYDAEFFEEDEDPVKIAALLDRGPVGLTGRPPAWMEYNVLTGKMEPGVTNG